MGVVGEACLSTVQLHRALDRQQKRSQKKGGSTEKRTVQPCREALSSMRNTFRRDAMRPDDVEDGWVVKGESTYGEGVRRSRRKREIDGSDLGGEKRMAVGGKTRSEWTK